ncbi:MAG: CHAT domain-containing protein [Anaerolineae bacterium]|nr:CHAT domain-containing protein [Anaerolineae bacterium]
MRKVLLLCCISLIVVMVVQSQASLNGTITEAVSILEDASPDSASLAQPAVGDQIQILESVEGAAQLTISADANAIWYRVQYGDVTGYIWSGFVYIDTLNGIAEAGRTALNANRTDDALERFEEGLDNAVALQSPIWQGEFLLLMARALAAEGRYEAAYTTTAEALDLFASLAFNYQVAEAYSTIGDIAALQGDYSKAYSSYGDALSTYYTLESIAGQIDINLREARIEILRGSLASARRTLDEVIEADLDGTASETIKRLEALYATQIGNYSLALDLYSEILENETDESTRAVLQRERADILRQQGRYGEAQNLYNESLAIFQALGDWREEVITLRSLGDLYSEQGRFALAGDNYRIALDTLPEDAQSTLEAEIRLALGQTFMRQGASSQAISLFEQTLLIATNSVTVQIGAQMDIGQAFAQISEDSLALKNLHEAYEIARVNGSDALYRTSLLRLGEVYLVRRHYDRAIDYFSQWLDANYNQINRVERSEVLVRLGLAYELSGDIELAIETYTEAISLNENILQDAALYEAVASISNNVNVRVPYQRLSVLLAKQDNLELALEYAERSQAVVARSELLSDQLDFGSSNNGQFLDEESDIRLALQDAQNLYYAALQNQLTGNDVLGDLENQLQNLRRQYIQFLDRLRLQGGYMNRRLAFNAASLSQIRSSIPPDTTLLIYSTNHRLSQIDQRLNLDGIVFIVTQSDLSAVTLSADSLQVAAVALKAFSSNRITAAQELRGVYDALIEPISEQLTMPNLIIAADGIFTYAPFAALPLGDKEYLIDNFAISMIDSGTSLFLLSQRTTRSATEEALVASQSDAPGLSSLTRVDEEVQHVASLLGVTPYLNATEGEVVNNVPGNRIVWLSAHAELDPFSPQFSTIHLAPSEGTDGRLEVREIYGLDLSQGTELVVLSGCETGVLGTGNDFGQLNRAFLAAGAPRVIASLWTVDDMSTTELLTTYAGLRQTGLSDASALQQAIIQLRTEYSDPYYWAAFTLTGEP